MRAPASHREDTPMTRLATKDALALSTRTLAYYDRVAESFCEGTIAHDVTQNHSALLESIEGTPPFRILDLGCGPGRDLAHFRALGHRAGSSRSG